MRQFACLQRAAARIAGKAGSFQTCGRLKCLQIALPCTVQGEHQVSRMRIGQTKPKRKQTNAGVGPMPPPSIGGDGLALICMPRALPMHEAALQAQHKIIEAIICRICEPRCQSACLGQARMKEVHEASCRAVAPGATEGIRRPQNDTK